MKLSEYSTPFKMMGRLLSRKTEHSVSGARDPTPLQGQFLGAEMLELIRAAAGIGENWLEPGGYGFRLIGLDSPSARALEHLQVA